MGRWVAPERRPLSNSNNFYPIFTKLGESVYGHKISVKFDNGRFPDNRDCVYAPILTKLDIWLLINKTQVKFDNGRNPRILSR